ncbi:hypothetical protein K474DRAFT_1663907 [Panus rudis PR-1116 ss-1]|nr:hypothetical protein K474DRAFT_1663907 [Panus rudis PR-1116 ss-1]
MSRICFIVASPLSTAPGGITFRFGVCLGNGVACVRQQGVHSNTGCTCDSIKSVSEEGQTLTLFQHEAAKMVRIWPA